MMTFSEYLVSRKIRFMEVGLSVRSLEEFLNESDEFGLGAHHNHPIP